MASKPKPKSNRAKFTLGKKSEKSKEKVEAPKKEKKVEEVVEKQEEIVTVAPKEETPPETQSEVSTPEITHRPEPLSPEHPTHEETTQQMQQPELPTNPFSVTMPSVPEHPMSDQNESPFAAPASTANEQQEPTQQTDQLPVQTSPAESSELSSTLPKEDPMPRQSSFSTPVEVETSNKGKGLILYFIIVAFVAFLVGIGSMALFTFGFGKMGSRIPHPNLFHMMTKTTPTPQKMVKVTSPTPVPTKAVDLSTYNIKVLNGSGITGAASKLKTELTTDGFTVVSTANADKSDYTDTIIASKKDINPDYLNKLKDVLKKEFSLGQDTHLSDTDAKAADVIITIGSNTAK